MKALINDKLYDTDHMRKIVEFKEQRAGRLKLIGVKVHYWTKNVIYRSYKGTWVEYVGCKDKLFIIPESRVKRVVKECNLDLYRILFNPEIG